MPEANQKTETALRALMKSLEEREASFYQNVSDYKLHRSDERSSDAAKCLLRAHEDIKKIREAQLNYFVRSKNSEEQTSVAVSANFQAVNEEIEILDEIIDKLFNKFAIDNKVARETALPDVTKKKTDTTTPELGAEFEDPAGGQKTSKRPAHRPRSVVPEGEERKKIGVYVGETVFNRITAEAQEQGITTTEMVRRLILRHLEP